MKPSGACKNLYSFVRLRLGDGLSDREIARRWTMEWKSFSALKHGRRQMPRIDELEQLSRLMGIDAAFVFEVARGVSAKLVHTLLLGNDSEKLSRLLMTGVHAVRRQVESDGLRYAAILDRVSDGVFTMDVQGRLQDVNRRLCALTGFSSAELLERSLFDLLLPAQRPQLVAKTVAVYQTGEVHGATFLVAAKNGAELVLELGLTRIDDGNGQAIGIQGVAHDVTGRRRLEEALQQQVATLKMTFDAVPAASLLFAKDGTILLANRLVENVCEWTAEEITGRNAFEVFGNPGPVGCPVTRAFQTGKLEQQVSKVRNKRGDEVYVHRTAGPVLAAAGDVDKVVEIMVDVTDQLRKGDPQLIALWSKAVSPGRGQELTGAEKRKFLRVLVEVPVRYQAGRRRGRAVARNLGRGGLFLETGTSISVGAEVTLEWALPGRSAAIKAVGVVIWNQPKANGTPGGLGIQFSELASPIRKAIASCVSTTAKKLARPRAGARARRVASSD